MKVGVGAGVNRPSLRTVCAVFPRTALPSTQGQPKSMLSAMNNTIAGQCGLKVEQPPSCKASVWPFQMQTRLPDAVPVMPSVKYRPQSPPLPPDYFVEDLPAIPIAEIVEPPTQNRRELTADLIHR